MFVAKRGAVLAARAWHVDASCGRAMEDPSGHVEGQIDMPTLVDGWAKHPSVLERYYTTYSTSNGQNLHVHSNGYAF